MTDDEQACCAPARERSGSDTAGPIADRPAGAAVPGRHRIEQVTVPAGVFLMGDQTGHGNRPDGEVPVHEVELAAFGLDATPVTNAAFAAFVAETGYVTEAETFGFSAVFHMAFAGDDDDIVGSPSAAPWWYGVSAADWRRPGGRHSDLDGKDDHPVVHVSWNDAMAYSAWAGRRLPTEAEWEHAARGGLAGHRFPWGDELMGAEWPSSIWPCNIWQGEFPTVNTTDDGFLTTAPAYTYEPNGYGLWQMVGNVWEWCADWFDARYYEHSPRANPPGPATGEQRVIRGGSYLCHDSYCNRYRCSARSSNTPDSSTANMGFRTAAPA